MAACPADTSQPHCCMAVPHCCLTIAHPTPPLHAGGRGTGRRGKKRRAAQRWQPALQTPRSCTAAWQCLIAARPLPAQSLEPVR